MAKYVLDNAGEGTEHRFVSLESCWDPVTIAHFERIGVAGGGRVWRSAGVEDLWARGLASTLGSPAACS
jgi:hypothetical protein